MRVFEAKDRRFGGYLEEYEVGDLFRHWPGKTVTEADNHLFCLLTLAAQPLHIDANYMTSGETIYDRNVVVGSYVYSLLLGMSVPDMSGRAIANLGTTDLKHHAPVFHGDTIYGESTVLEARVSSSRPGTGILTFETRGMTDASVMVASFTRSVLLPRRPIDG
jgi:acyl dehydratase